MFFVVPVSTPLPSAKLPSSWDPRTTLRTLIAYNFATCSTLAELAASNADKYGPAIPPGLDSNIDRSDAAFAMALKACGIKRKRVRHILSPCEAPTTSAPPTRVIPSQVNRIFAQPKSARPVTTRIVRVHRVGTRQARSSTVARLPRMRPDCQNLVKLHLAPTTFAFALVPNKTTKHLGYEPKNIKEARAHPSWPLWQQAIADEFQGLQARGTWTERHISEVPDNTRIMHTMWVLKDKKTSGPKARLTVRGDQQWPRDAASDKYTATPSPTEVRTLLSTAHQLNHAIQKLDISQAFVQSDDIARNLYVHPPREARATPGTVYLLKKPLYGVGIAPRCWSDTFRRFLKDYGFKPVNFSDTYMVWTSPDGNDTMQLIFHIDDTLLSFGNAAHGTAFKKALFAKFDGTDEGDVNDLLGCKIIRDDKHLHISQEQYLEELLETWGMESCNSVKTPLDPNTRLLLADRPAQIDTVLRAKFQSIVGSIQWAAQWTRPDLQFCANELAKHNSNPGEVHLAACFRVLRYIRGTTSLGITYSRNLPDANRLIMFADADWASDTETRRSLAAWVGVLNGGAVTWKSRSAPRVACSTTEAEFVAASRAADECLWLRRTLADVHVAQKTATPLYSDNRATRMLSLNPVLKERTKHVDYRVHALRERVADNVVRVLDCPTADMLADPMTKQLPAPAHYRHTLVMLGKNPSTAPPPPTTFPALNVIKP